MLFFFLAVGLIFAFASLYSSIILYKNFRGVGLSAFASNEGEVSLSIEVSIDTTPPNVNITDPLNITYTSQRTGIDYTVSDATSLDSCWYSLDSGVTNVSITCGNNVTGITSVTGDNVWRVYANDSTNNQNVSSVSFVVTISEDVEEAGGGGGGGVALTRIEKFEIDPEEINLVIEVGKRDFREIKVRNTGGKTLTINISVTGIEYIVSADFNYLTVSPGEERRILLSINAPVEPGIFVGKIIFEAGDVKREVFVLVNVRSGEVLFDVSLTIPESFKIISPGNNIESFISLIQIGPIEQVEVTATYLIKDFDGNVLFTETESFFVLESKNFVKEFPTADLAEGDYIAGIEVTYPEGFAASSDRFTISKREFLLNIAVILILISLILLIIAIILLAIRKYKKSGRRSFHKRK